jgi:hypothetical protein
MEREQLRAASTLVVTVKSSDEFHEDVTDDIESLEHGDSVDTPPTLSSTSYDDLMEPLMPRVLECQDGIRQGAQTLAEQAEERGVTTGVHPAGFAAACLYKPGQEQGQWVTQSDVAETGNITQTTVRTHRETLEEQIA